MLSSFYGFGVIPVAMWSLVSLSLVSTFSEENGSVFALFMVHPSAGHCSSSLGVPGQCSCIPCSCLLKLSSPLPPPPLQASARTPASSRPHPLLICILAQAHYSLTQCKRSSPYCRQGSSPKLRLPWPSLPHCISSPFSTRRLSFGCICILFLPS